MNSYTAEAYRAAAEIARRSGGQYLPAAADAWDKKADELNKRELYTFKLGNLFRPGDTAYVNGARTISTLLEDGWTAPEGLL